MPAVKFLGKGIVSAGILGSLAGLMLHFHIATYDYLAWALVGSLAIYLWSRPSIRSLAGTVVLGAVLAITYGIVHGGPLLGTCLAFPRFGQLGQLESGSAVVLIPAGGTLTWIRASPHPCSLFSWS